jgi:hypothetical protein
MAAARLQNDSKEFARGIRVEGVPRRDWTAAATRVARRFAR